MSAYDKQNFCVLRTNPLRTAYRLKKPEYCVPKGGCHPHTCISLFKLPVCTATLRIKCVNVRVMFAFINCCFITTSHLILIFFDF